MIKPKRLSRGQKVAAISLSWGGPGTFRHRYEAGKRQFEQMFGLTVVEMPHALRDPAWLAANPQARAADLIQAFTDPDIAGIISTIGGDDSIRLLRYLDLEVIRQHPKVFMGYSDTTVTHFACYQAGLVSFYGPAFMAGFAENGGIFPYLVDSVQRILFSSERKSIWRSSSSPSWRAPSHESF
jgi:muramoyltetrapeptide carboxypeptidase LdcA involved in peptidoglycan recycling